MSTPVIRRRSYLPFPVEVVAAILARLLYRVKSSGIKNVPVTGGAVLIANHLSYVDAVVLQLVCPRRIRFVGFHGLIDQRLLDLCLRWSGAISIS